MSKQLIVGIDLGTTNSCVSIFRNGQLEMLNNKEGQYVTPSYVFITNSEVIVGKHAKKMAATKPEHGVYEIKRLIGRQFYEVANVHHLDDLSFAVKNRSGKPVVYVEEYKKYFTPEEITTLILKKIKNDATEKLGQTVTKAVITVPAHFNVSQRKATLQAAQAAGFTVLKLLSEPTAAALNYFYELRREKDVDGKFFLVYDLGGGTFDVSIVQKQNQNINVIAVDGDSHLGGKDFDKLVSEHILQQLKNKYNLKSKLDRRAMRRLKNESETTKESLSSTQEALTIFEGFLNIDVAEVTVTRKELEDLLDPLFKRSISVLDRCIKNSELKKSDIERVILAGGSTRIPKIEKMLEEYFNSKSLAKILHPEECVAKGAALQAAMLSQHPDQTLEHFIVKEVASSSLGIGDHVDRMNFLIKKNTPTPTSSSVTHTTVSDQQKTICFQIFEGERIDARKNFPLGKLEISDLTPAPPGKCHVTLTMNIDENGILDITAQETSRNNTRKLQIVLVGDSHVNARSNEVYSEQQNKEEDLRFAEFAGNKEFLLTYCTTVKYNMKNLKLINKYKLVFDKCNEMRKEIKELDLKHEEKLMQLGAEALSLFGSFATKHKFVDMPKNPILERKFAQAKFVRPLPNDEQDEDLLFGTVPVKEKKIFF